MNHFWYSVGMKENKSYLTAIARKALPVPTRWLISKGLTKGNVLDYGCGKCANLNPVDWNNYDPHYAPIDLANCKFDTVICNYVLNTLPENEQAKVLKQIGLLLADNGVAYVSVRTDCPEGGWGYSSRGTYQTKVTLPFEVVKKVADYCIYRLTKAACSVILLSI